MAYSMQDAMDDYKEMTEEKLIAEILGDEITESETLEPTTTAPTPIIEYIEYDKFPAEIREMILAPFLPEHNTPLKAITRNGRKSPLQLPRTETRVLKDLFLVSRSFTADIVTLILSRCPVMLMHDDVADSLKILEKPGLCLASPFQGSGIAAIRYMNMTWAPGTRWNAEEVQRFCNLLTGATGLVELEVTIPFSWWKVDKKVIWKRGFSMISASAPNLEAIELKSYQPTQQTHAGWNALAGTLWKQVDAGVLDDI